MDQWIEEGWIDHIDQLLLEVHMYKHIEGEEKQSKVLHNVPLSVFHVARNKWDGTVLDLHEERGEMTSVYEIGFITP